MFVDYYSNLFYVHFQSLTTSKETVEAKEVFVANSREMGVIIRYYHAYNGRFSDNNFILHIKKSGQIVSYCGVNAHIQNRRAEKWIRDLQESARTQLLHDKARWSRAITINLWPYTLSVANIYSTTRCPYQVSYSLNTENHHLKYLVGLTY